MPARKVFGAVMAACCLGIIVSPSLGRAPRPAAWEDHFTSLDASRWIVFDGYAPGYIPNNHIGVFEPDNTSVQDGFLVLRLSQERSPVDANPSGVLSRGGGIYSRETYGFGTYEWRMRMSSTATTPEGQGGRVPGSVSAGFVYVNNSQTEIDFESAAADSLVMANWRNNSADGPYPGDATTTVLPLVGISRDLHTYKFVWERGRVSFYVDNVLQIVHTTNVPHSPANLLISHWGSNNPHFGGPATVEVERFFYIDWLKFTPLR